MLKTQRINQIENVAFLFRFFSFVLRYLVVNNSHNHTVAKRCCKMSLRLLHFVSLIKCTRSNFPCPHTHFVFFHFVPFHSIPLTNTLYISCFYGCFAVFFFCKYVLQTEKNPEHFIFNFLPFAHVSSFLFARMPDFCLAIFIFLFLIIKSPEVKTDQNHEDEIQFVIFCSFVGCAVVGGGSYSAWNASKIVECT